MRSPFSTKLIIANLAIVLMAGCGGSKLPKVTGKITVNGTPAVGAVLLFHPVNNPEAKIATAVAGSDGTFTLMSEMKDEVQPGNYKVSLTWPDPAHKSTEAQKLRGEVEPGADLLKGRYVMKEKSGLSVDITSSTKELPPFELKTK